ncbi:MAG: hypothetical protein G01um101413_237 [Parcubacteria group bacterium Gr01-1014_13]|nr:MAG: hypothetical protein G01um101413_237 [Parcubacteria group bacterium Gr01-1014_13]
MKFKACLMFALFIFAFAACHSDTESDDSVADAGPNDVGTSEDEEILLGYEAEMAAYQAKIGMLPEWADWMLKRKNTWSRAYLSGRHEHEVNVYVRYENPVLYNPPWTNEAEHFATLKRLAELQFPGWSFTFLEYQPGMDADQLPGHDIVATLGGTGTSYGGGHKVYLVYETIFAHEFGHTLGLHHHYCGSGNEPGDHTCPEAYPPGEDECIMNRNSVSFGPTENTFLLLTTGERWDEEIATAMSNILDRYPGQGFAPVNWNECGMDQ